MYTTPTFSTKHVAFDGEGRLMETQQQLLRTSLADHTDPLSIQHVLKAVQEPICEVDVAPASAESLEEDRQPGEKKRRRKPRRKKERPVMGHRAHEPRTARP